jgi:hypothetical protein
VVPSAAAGGGSIREPATMISAPAARKTRARSPPTLTGRPNQSPTVLTRVPTATAARVRSTISNTVHELNPGSYQSRKRLTSSSVAPSAARISPAFSLRGMRPPYPESPM